MKTDYTHDAAGRVTVVDHQSDLGISLLKLSYDYDNLDLPVTLTEEDALNVPATTYVTYENRETDRSSRLFATSAPRGQPSTCSPGRAPSRSRRGLHSRFSAMLFGAGGLALFLIPAPFATGAGKRSLQVQLELPIG